MGFIKKKDTIEDYKLYSAPFVKHSFDYLTAQARRVVIFFVGIWEKALRYVPIGRIEGFDYYDPPSPDDRLFGQNNNCFSLTFQGKSIGPRCYKRMKSIPMW